VQTVASSGSSSAQCGHVFTLPVSARSHDRLYRLTASIIAVGPLEYDPEGPRSPGPAGIVTLTPVEGEQDWRFACCAD
jgi:hypothetical protein